MAYNKRFQEDEEIEIGYVEEKTGGKFPFKVRDVILKEDQVLSDNNLLKKKKVKHVITQEQQLEIVKCKLDPIYFIENYIRIISLDDGLIPMNPYPYQREMIKAFNGNRFSINLLARQMGKALDVDTPIPTENGFVRMGDIKVGDYVLAPNGNSVRVNFATEYQYDRKCYEIVFDTGERIVADADHIWTVIHKGNKVDLTTKEIIKLNYEDIKIEASKPVKLFMGMSIKERELFLDDVRNDLHIRQTIAHSLGYKTVVLSGSLMISKTDSYHRISCIIKTYSRPVKCIQVESEDHLYLCGRGFIPTHNTTVVAAYIVWHAIFNPGQTCAVLANKEAQSQEIMDRIRLMIENLPFFLMPGIVDFNKMSIRFDNESKIFGAASGSSSIRGKSISLLYLDEMAFLAQDEDFFASTYPTITSGKKTKVIITSTPNGARGVFYRLYQGAVEGTNDYIPLKFIWSDVPGRDEEWARKTESVQGKAKFRQEMNCEFLGSSNTLIAGEILAKLQFQNSLNDDLYLSVYEEPKPGHIYVAIVDPSEGIGKDYSVVNIIDVSELPYRQVCTYANNTIDMMIFPNTVYSIASRYNNALTLIESNNESGGMVNYSFYYELEYENTVLTSSDDNGLSIKIGGRGAKPGVKTSKKTKGIGCANLKTLLENDKLILRDGPTINELGTFVQHHNSWRADADCTDDRVMTLVMFSWLVKQPVFIEMTNNDVAKTILEQQKLFMYSDILPFGFVPQEYTPSEEVTIQNDYGIKETIGNPFGFDAFMKDRPITETMPSEQIEALRRMGYI